MSLIIGKIVKAQGIKGEVKIVPITDDVLRFNNLKHVFIGSHELKIENVRIDKNNNLVYIKFSDVLTRNDAEKLVNNFISVPREEACKLPKDGYFIVDLIGCNVAVDNEIIGKLKEVLQNGKVDIYVVESNDKKSIMFPAIKKVIKNIDIENKIIEIDKKHFDEVAVYE